MSTSINLPDVVVIGAGPSGSVASAMLNKLGHRVLVLERQYFPRFSIGESLLPQCMTFLEQADMLAAVEAAGFQFKNGAAFSRAKEYEDFDFREKFSTGWGTTFQVQRARFDEILADQASNQGVEIRFGHSLKDYESNQQGVRLTVEDEHGKPYQIATRFVLDASGFGRVLPRLLNLEKPSEFASRTSIFTHVKDSIGNRRFDRNKTLITIHPHKHDVWYWLIPFSNGRASIGVVAPDQLLEEMPGDSESRLRELIAQGGMLAGLLENAEFDTEISKLCGYSSNVTQLFGDHYALLGNAGEFLDPIFSSGVTIALKSANLAAQVLHRHLAGLSPDWDREFSVPLKQGVDSFRVLVNAWYDGRLQDIIFAPDKNDQVKRMICSIFAGYAWDTENPYIENPARIDTLAELCRRG